jgi:hypothetical protein
VAARGHGIAPAAVRAVTDWVFDTFARTSLRQVMLVHDVGNPASCRVADKAGYPFRELSLANPPHWFTDGHIHLRLTWAGHGAQRATTCPGGERRAEESRGDRADRRARDRRDRLLDGGGSVDFPHPRRWSPNAQRGIDRMSRSR